MELINESDCHARASSRAFLWIGLTAFLLCLVPTMSLAESGSCSCAVKPNETSSLPPSTFARYAMLPAPRLADEEGFDIFQARLLRSLAGRSVRWETPRPRLCFAPGTPRDIAEALNLLTGTGAAPADAYQFAESNRWSETAMSAGSLAQGDPTVITWSIAPDGTQIPAFNATVGESNDSSDLIAFLDGIYGGAGETDLELKPWFPIVSGVFARWGELTGNTYLYEPNDDGKRFHLLEIGRGASPGEMGVRGDVRLGGHEIDGDSGVLAYNFFPDVGEMVLDTADAFYSDTSDDSLRLRNVMLHEHGHGLGLSHVCPVVETKLMEPFYSEMFEGPQFDDILAGHRGYGDPNEPNDDDVSATSLGVVSNGVYTIEDVSIDDESDDDWYGLDIAANKQIAVTITPVGSIYLNGPQNIDGSCTVGTPFNASAEQDLAISVVGLDGSTVISAADLNPAGMMEAISGVNLGGAGTYYVRVTGSTVNTAQLYDLEITIADAALPTLIGAASRKLHENAGGESATYDVPLNLGAVSTVEPRVGGADQIVLDFTLPVTLGCGSITLDNATCDSVVDQGDGTSWLVSLSDVAENSCETLTLSGAAGLDPSSPLEVRVRSIVGDVDGSGGATIIDLSAVKNAVETGSVVDETNFRFDVQLSNSLTLIDLSTVKANTGGSATCLP